jgi:GDPmannose 4,6-dehydratase
MKKALITGISGQDGAYLAEFLLQKGYKVYGGLRRTAGIYSWRLMRLGVVNDVEFIDFELFEYSNIKKVLATIQPDEIYNLAAQSFVGLSFEQPLLTADIDALGVLRILEAVRELGLSTRIYQASSSEMFGKVHATPQDESTPFHPRSPYAVSKVFAHWSVINYREAYKIFGSNGILFNHESPLRGEEFVTRKITKGIAGIKSGERKCIELGNLDAKRDWGYAKDYVEAMWLILNHNEPDDFVIATGENHGVREFVEHAFDYIGKKIQWRGSGVSEEGLDAKSKEVRVRVSPKFYRPADVDALVGNSSKAKKLLGWTNKTDFKELVSIMMKGELESEY